MGRDRTARPGARPLRLFVAVSVPREVRRMLSAAAAPVRERYPHARWVPDENQHVTLKFLGSTWPRLLDWLSEAIDEVARSAAPFDVAVEGLGAFPSVRRARVLWAGLDDGRGRLRELAGALDVALAREFRAEKRPFTAHLTLARFEPPVALDQAVFAVPSAAFGVDRLVLFRSHLRRPAPVYEPIETFALGG